MTATFTRWVIELDYDADPDTDGETIRKSLKDEIAAAKGQPKVVGERKIVFDTIDDAFSFRLRFCENIVSVNKLTHDHTAV